MLAVRSELVAVRGLGGDDAFLVLAPHAGNGGLHAARRLRKLQRRCGGRPAKLARVEARRSPDWLERVEIDVVVHCQGRSQQEFKVRETFLEFVIQRLNLALAGLRVLSLGLPFVRGGLTQRLPLHALLLAYCSALRALCLKPLALQIPLDLCKEAATSCHLAIIFWPCRPRNVTVSVQTNSGSRQAQLDVQRRNRHAGQSGL